VVVVVVVFVVVVVVAAAEFVQILMQLFFSGTRVAICSRNEHSFVRIEPFMVVTMMNGVFWDVKSCGSCKNRRFGGT
jgi:hypothetical protein